MNIYLLRHGKTDNHDRKVRQGPDSDLGQTGLRQAHLVADRLTQMPLDLIIASPWARAHTTAQIVSQKIGLAIQLEELIHEQANNPILDNIPYEHELNDLYFQEAMTQAKNNIDWKFRGKGESMRDVLNRAKEFKKALLHNHFGKSVLVVSHGAFLSLFISTFLHDDNSPDEYLIRSSFTIRSQENTALSHLQLDPKRNEWVLKYFNDHSHLSDMMQS